MNNKNITDFLLKILQAKILFFVSLIILFSTSCEQSKKPIEEHTQSIVKKPAIKHNLTGTAHKIEDFYQEYHEAYPVGTSNASNDVRSIAMDSSSNIWIATAEGVFVKNQQQNRWTRAITGHNNGPAYSIEIAVDGSVWMGTWNGVYQHKDGKTKKLEGIKPPISVLCPSDDGMYALGPNGVWIFENNEWNKKKYKIAKSVRDAVTDDNGDLWIATDVGLYHCSTTFTKLYQDENELISCYVQGLAFDPVGRLWAGGLGGITIRDANYEAKPLTPKDGLPTVYVRCIDISPKGVMWIGTDAGVLRYYNDGSHSLRFSRRWLLDDHVRDITFDKDGTSWIATAKGVSAIRKKYMTLDDKADYFYGVLMRRHIRSPWIAGQCRLKIPGDTTSWVPEDDDNDGQYTAMYLAMESFRFAATESEDAQKKAKKAFEFLKYLQDVTGNDGFIARTIIPANWNYKHDPNRTYTKGQIAEELVQDPRYKPVSKRWRRSKNGKWWWKGDTSSDEMTGHMFGFFFYHLLVANDEEKAVVANHVRKLMDYLIDNNYNLVDIDGKHTHWGVWSPDKLNNDPDWEPEKGINSLELLSYLKLTYELTGDEKYQKEYTSLIKKHHYLENAQRILHSNPAWTTYIDPELILLAFPPLIMYETDPKLKLQWEQLLDKWYDGFKKDKSPFYNMMYSYLRNQRTGVENSVEFLMDTPLDLVDWKIDHTKREDISIVRTPVLESLQTSELQPPSLRAVVRWDKNPWDAINGNPAREREPVFWLLPYWIGKYTEIIE